MDHLDVTAGCTVCPKLTNNFLCKSPAPGEFQMVQIPAGGTGNICKTPGVARGEMFALEIDCCIRLTYFI